VPILMYGDEVVVGFDPEGIDRIVEAVRAPSGS
jgi:hypothetical protein